MAEFCKAYDENLWWEGHINLILLCEGHGRYEQLDKEGMPIRVTKPFSTEWDDNWIPQNDGLCYCKLLPIGHVKRDCEEAIIRGDF